MAAITMPEWLKRVIPGSDVALALGVIGLVVMLVLPLPGVVLVIGAALGWSLGNMVQRRAGQIDMLAFVVWSSLFAIPPLFLLALLFEGSAVMIGAVAAAGPLVWAVIAWQAIGNTMFGYGAWGWLLARYPASSVAPMALLVPVFGMGSAAIWLGEPLPAWKLLAALCIVGGLAINTLGPRLQTRRAA
jgi:O-acetylserine/cysteine efflux transporter